MSRRCRGLGARLLRGRALSVALGRRYWYLRPYDRAPGRPTVRESIALASFRKPVVEFDPGCYDDQSIAEQYKGLLVDAADSYLAAVGLEQGWFCVTERCQLLGTHITIRRCEFDVLVHRASLLSREVGNLHVVQDRTQVSPEVSHG